MRTILIDKICSLLRSAGRRSDMGVFAKYSYVILHRLEFLNKEEKDYLWSKIFVQYSRETIEKQAMNYNPKKDTLQRGVEQEIMFSNHFYEQIYNLQSSSRLTISNLENMVRGIEEPR